MYLPSVAEITFYFSSPFGIEENKDELYIGAGLEFSPEQINGKSDKSTQKYFFEGRTVPPAFTISSNKVWMYFISDKNNKNMKYEGFRVSWEAPPDTTSPVVTDCPSNIVKTIDPGVISDTFVTWKEPKAVDDSGTVTLTQRSNQPGSIFFTGTTHVVYTFCDPSGNIANCSFDVITKRCSVAKATTLSSNQWFDVLTEKFVGLPAKVLENKIQLIAF